MAAIQILERSRAAGSPGRRPAAGERDRYMDFLRALSMAVVVLGHWISAKILLGDGGLEAGSVLDDSPHLHALTWVLQIMPLFFFVGGFSNLTSLRRARNPRAFLTSRARRLLGPAAAFVGIVAAGVLALRGTSLLPAGGAPLPMALMPLWFLAVYLFLVFSTPAMARLHERFGAWAAVGLGAGVVAVDAARFGLGVEGVKWANLAFVWLLAHQMGFLYADGALQRAGRRAHAAMAGGGLLALGALTGSGLYPTSMVGVRGERFSNMNPPTLAIAATAVWLVGAAMLARGAATTWLRRERAWRVVSDANRRAMTVYLWHLPAFGIAAAVLLGLGLGRSEATFWLEKPVWIAVAGLVLWALVSALSRFEAGGRPRKQPTSLGVQEAA